ncbi:hypothetical protein FRC00_008086, partial [Tulasnella sp. 408]
MADSLFLQQAPLSKEYIDAFSGVINQPVHIAASTIESRLLRDTALIPVCASAISFGLLVIYLITRIARVRLLITCLSASSDEPIGTSRRDAGFTTVPPLTFRDELKEHIVSHGGIVVYLHNALRLAICLSLLGISTYAAIVAPRPKPKPSSLDTVTLAEGSDAEAQRGKHRKHKKGVPGFSHQEWVEIAQCVFYNPLPPNPEQTASILSFITWTFLDPVVLEASRVSHLPYESLPILADYDYVEHLMARGAPTLDPSLKPRRDRHFVWGLLWLYRWQYAALFPLTTVKAVSALVSPVVLNKLLYYLETGGEGAVYKPWVWIAGLFLAPVCGSIGFHLYVFITTRLIIRTEALVTQLVFEHSLKIRVKSETSKEASSPESRAATPGRGHEHPREGSEDTVVGESGQVSSSPKGKARSEPSSSPRAKMDDKSQKDKSLVGKMTNLISTDLGHIVEARDFLFFIWYVPLQIVLSTWFLYKILGWAAFVGPAVLIATFPIPGTSTLCVVKRLPRLTRSKFIGYVATFLNDLQVDQVKMTDARVQATTETLGVIRMVKLFGWERKVEAQISEKREAELGFLRKKQMLQLLNISVNRFLPVLTLAATFATYTLVMKKQLSASIIFSSIAVFDVIQERLYMISYALPKLVAAKVSFDRINDFLLQTELLDRYTSSGDAVSLGALPPTADSEAIGFRNAVFSWSADAPSTPGGILTPSRRNFRLRIEDDLFFQKRKINLIIGPTGC